MNFYCNNVQRHTLSIFEKKIVKCKEKKLGILFVCINYVELSCILD